MRELIPGEDSIAREDMPSGHLKVVKLWCTLEIKVGFDRRKISGCPCRYGSMYPSPAILE